MAYRVGAAHFVRLLWYLLLGTPRPIAPVVERTLAGVSPPPRAEGLQHIPEGRPLVVVANHYERPGLWVVWGGLVIIRAVHQRRPASTMHWVITSEWRGHRLGPLPLPVAFAQWLLKRTARAAGAIVMPAEEQPRQRLRALRAITDLLSDPHGNHVVGILPEGPVGESRLVAMKGAGAFLYYLYQRGIPILPVGLGEWDGVLVAAFGEPIRLHLPPGLDKEEQDTEAGRQVMAAIARLLPLEASRRDS